MTFCWPFLRVVAIGLSPNLEGDDVLLAIKTLVWPFAWQSGAVVEKVEAWFREYFGVADAVSFNSGRSALTTILRAFDIGEGDEVLVQAFTCVAVPNSVLWAGAKPAYVDIDHFYNINPNDLPAKLTKKTKALIVQHTFGIPAQIEAIASFCKQHDLLLIEDCAHALGACYKGKPIGSFGDAAVFSFGRDKVISSVFGGVGIVFRPAVAVKLRKIQQLLPDPKLTWIGQQLLHPIATYLVLYFYSVVLGKFWLLLLQKLRLLSVPVSPIEKKGQQPKNYPEKFPNALAVLGYHQLQKLDRFNKERKNSAAIYQQVLNPEKDSPNKTPIFLRFPIEVADPAALLKKAKAQGFVLGNWYHNVVDPTGVDLQAVGYKAGSCPRAEEVARRIVNLPTRIRTWQAHRVAGLVAAHL